MHSLRSQSHLCVSPLLAQLHSLERSVRISTPLPSERETAMNAAKDTERWIAGQEPSRCPITKLLGAPAKILAYYLMEKLIGSFWTLVENDLALRASGTAPLAIRTHSPINTYMSQSRFKHLVSQAAPADRPAVISDMMRDSVYVWTGSLGPETRILTMKGPRLDALIKDLAPGLEQSSPTILQSVSTALLAALSSNQTFFVDVHHAICASLEVEGLQARSRALSVLRDAAHLHVNTFIAFSVAVSGMPADAVFTQDKDQNILLGESMLNRVRAELEQLGRRTPRLGCPASRAVATLRDGREVRVLGRYLLWFASVHKEA